MSRARNPKRDQAKEIWLKSNGEKVLKDIAKELGVTASTIRKWKSTDNWTLGDKGSAPFEKERYHSMRSNRNAAGNTGGAPPRNQNAIGNAGGAPKHNKNALVTGEYEMLSFDTLTDEERELFEGVTDDPLVTINTQIRELKIRQHRIMMRIKRRETQHAGEVETTQSYEYNEETETMDPLGGATKSSTQLADLVKLESALDSVNSQLLRAVNQKQRIIESLAPERRKLLNAQIEKAEAEALQLRQLNNDLGMEKQMHDMSLEDVRRLANAKDESTTD